MNEEYVCQKSKVLPPSSHRSTHCICVDANDLDFGGALGEHCATLSNAYAMHLIAEEEFWCATTSLNRLDSLPFSNLSTTRSMDCSSGMSARSGLRSVTSPEAKETNRFRRSGHDSGLQSALLPTPKRLRAIQLIPGCVVGVRVIRKAGFNIRA